MRALLPLALVACLLAPAALASQTATGRYAVVLVSESCEVSCGGVGVYIGLAVAPGATVTLRVVDDVKAAVGAGYAFYGPSTPGFQPRTAFCDGVETVTVPAWADRVVLEVQTVQEAQNPSLNYCGVGMEGTRGTLSIAST